MKIKHTPGGFPFLSGNKVNVPMTKIIFFFSRCHLFIFIESEREGEKERNINGWLPLARPLLGTWPATQACAPTGN